MNNGPFSRFKDSLPGNGVYYCTADKVYENDSAKDLSERIRADKIKGKNSVCIIEGISDIYKDQLKAIQSTFVEFATRHSGRTDQEGDLPRTNQTPVEVYIKAVFYYHTWKGSNADVKVFRTAATEGDIEPVHKPWITHLSYCRITPHCCQYLWITFSDRS
jgi:hypothetical protein